MGDALVKSLLLLTKSRIWNSPPIPKIGLICGDDLRESMQMKAMEQIDLYNETYSTIVPPQGQFIVSWQQMMLKKDQTNFVSV